MNKGIRLFLVLAWAVVIYILISSPVPEYKSLEIAYFDKVVHAVLFGIFAGLIVYTLISGKLQLKLILFFSALASILYVALGEFIQIYIPGRTASIYDFLAGVIGISISLTVVYAKYKEKKA